MGSIAITDGFPLLLSPLCRGALSAAANDQCRDRDDGMEVIIGPICQEEIKDVSVPEKSGEGHNAIHGAEDHEVPLRKVVGARGVQGGQAAEEVDGIVGEVDGEQEERAIGEKSGDAENRQDDAENLRKRLYFFVKNIAGSGHIVEGGKSGGNCSTLFSKISCNRRDGEEENTDDGRSDPDPLMRFETLMVEENTEAGGEDDVALADGGGNGNRD